MLMIGDYEALYLLYFISFYTVHVDSRNLFKSNNNFPQILHNTVLFADIAWCFKAATKKSVNWQFKISSWKMILP